MLNFRRWLFESTFTKRPNGAFIHQANIGGDDFKFVFKPMEGQPNKYVTYFDVNGSDNAKDADAIHGEKILRHFVRTFHAFIREQNPEHIKFIAADEDKVKQARKEKLYRTLARGLAKKYNGSYREDFVFHKLDFPKRKR